MPEYYGTKTSTLLSLLRHFLVLQNTFSSLDTVMCLLHNTKLKSILLFICAVPGPWHPPENSPAKHTNIQTKMYLTSFSRDGKMYQRANNVGVKNPIFGQIFVKFDAVLSRK